MTEGEGKGNGDCDLDLGRSWARVPGGVHTGSRGSFGSGESVVGEDGLSMSCRVERAGPAQMFSSPALEPLFSHFMACCEARRAT